MSQSNKPILIYDSGHLQLQFPKAMGFKPLWIDFLAGQSASRQQQAKSQRELLVKACGVTHQQKPSVIDVTAGMGQDAFVLASLGCDVLMLERSPIVAQLLQDALLRLHRERPDIKLSLQSIDALDYLPKILDRDKPEVIYIDPMFPERGKSAQVKKSMQVLRTLVGDDLDAEQLFILARATALKRVVVKRHRHAPPITDIAADIVFRGRVCRFDVYLS